MTQLLEAPEASNDLSTESAPYLPPVELRRFVQALLSEEVAGSKTEAQRVTGVDRGKFYFQMKYHPEFRRWFSDECDQFLAANEPVTASSLMRKIQKGDTLAIRTFYELRNKLRPAGAVVNIDNKQTRLTVIQQLHQLVNNGHQSPSPTNGHQIENAPERIHTNGRLVVVE